MPYPHTDKSPESEVEWFEALIKLARYLRSPDGCPWDRERNSKDFGVFLQEEAEELEEAFEKGDCDHIEEEFGDTFFCALLLVAAAEEEGKFSLKNALKRIHEKMIRRHEHVFGDVEADSPEQVLEIWNKVKKREREGKA